MRLELIESDIKYYEKSDKFSYEIKSYANDYELITFDYLSYNYRKFINSYNNKKTLSKRRAYPIPVGADLLYVGLHEIYFIDTINFLPTNQEIEIIKIIGPGEIKNNKLILYNTIEKILKRLNNKTHTIFYYYNCLKYNILILCNILL